MVSETDLKNFILAMIKAARARNLKEYRVLNAQFSEAHRDYQIENNLPRTTDIWDQARNDIANYFQFLLGIERSDLLLKAKKSIEVFA